MQVWLIPGSMFERRDDGHLQHGARHRSAGGTSIARYRKMFPFDAVTKSASIRAREFVVFDVPKVGAFRRLDLLRHVVSGNDARNSSSLGAEVILHPTMTDTIDRDVELPIARASATINQCYFFDVNGVGDGGTGRSIIIDPSGNVLHEAGRGAGDRCRSKSISIACGANASGDSASLGQTLKSFRDRPVDFPVYQRSGPTEAYLHSLGPLIKPTRVSPLHSLEAEGHPRRVAGGAASCIASRHEAAQPPPVAPLPPHGRRTGVI